MTLRQAPQLLADDGLVETRHGAGTYVAARYAYDLSDLPSFATDLSAQDADITTELLAAGAVTPPADVAARLAAPGEVLRLRRLRLSGGRPLIVQTSYLPAALAHIVEPENLGHRGLYTIPGRARTGYGPRRRNHHPRKLGPLDARDLARAQSSPALLSHRISFITTGIPVIDDYALLPADGVAITVNRSPGRLEVHYTLLGLADSAEVKSRARQVRAQKQTI